MKISKRHSGFTLIEVLISLVLFAIGALGVLLYSGNAVKSSLDNNARAIGISTASQVLEPLYVAAENGSATLQAALNALKDNNGVFKATVTGNGGRDSFTVTILEARDDNNLNVLTNPPPWQSPITLGVRIDYAGITGTKTVFVPMTLVTQ